MARPPAIIIETPPTLRGRSVELDRAGAVQAPWWLWPHLLGLDAPVVALVWQDWWGRAGRVSPSPGERLVLGLGVWLIYLADRLADVARGRLEDVGTARHTFAAAWRRPLLLLGTMVGGSLVVVAPCMLPGGEFRAGLGLLGTVGAYFWLIHRGRSPGWTRWLPKEAVVGGIFAVGTGFFALWRPMPAPGALFVGGGLFGVVCFLNCALITAWERSLPDRRDPASLLNAFPRLVGGGLALACELTALLALAIALTWHTVLPVPIALAAAALAGLDRGRRFVSADALRCLADAVLLTPAVCGAFVAVYQ